MPRKQCRTFTRSRGNRVLTAETMTVKLFDYIQTRGKGWEEWQFRSVSQEHVRKMLFEGTAEAVRRWKGDVMCCVGYRALVPARPMRRSACTLTLETMDAVSKRGKGEDLDFFERRDVEKFEVWALVGEPGLVRPRISAAEQKRAEHLLGAKWLPIGATIDMGQLAA